ncbi:MAG: hypothetical protein N2505_00340 [Endomicrobia bacterium]|nr:hypothetical protein [Endomicrobiia bacterium]
MKKILKIVLVLLIFTVCFPVDFVGQEKEGNKKVNVVKKNKVKKNKKKKKKVTKQIPSINALNKESRMKVLSGYQYINASYNPNEVITVGLYSQGVTVIEFPANDRNYKIHPGDEQLVTVDCGVRSDNVCSNFPEDAIVIRPGVAFNKPSIITVQKDSGFIVSIVAIPVKNIEEHAFYVNIRYDVEKMKQIRRNLNLVDCYSCIAKQKEIQNIEKIDIKQEEVKPVKHEEIKNKTNEDVNKENKEQDSDQEIRDLAIQIIKEYENKNFNINYGMYFIERFIRGDGILFDVVATKVDKDMLLTKNSPSLYIETLGKQGIQNITELNTKFIVTTMPDYLLRKDVIYYTVFVYEAPTLYQNQVISAYVRPRLEADKILKTILNPKANND